jgi:hypothetical protein
MLNTLSRQRPPGDPQASHATATNVSKSPDAVAEQGYFDLEDMPVSDFKVTYSVSRENFERFRSAIGTQLSGDYQRVAKLSAVDVIEQLSDRSRLDTSVAFALGELVERYKVPITKSEQKVPRSFE